MELLINYEIKEVVNSIIKKLESNEYYNIKNKKITCKLCNKKFKSTCGLVYHTRKNVCKREGPLEIISPKYKRNRKWTKEEENILLGYKRRIREDCVFMSWKKIGIKLNRPQKSVREKWRKMLSKIEEDSDEEIILLQPKIGI